MPELGSFAQKIFERTYQLNKSETWEGCADRVAKFIAGNKAEDDYKKFYEAIKDRKFMPGGRYLYASGRELPQITNCFLLRAEDSREGWGHLVDVSIQALTTGGGVGINYSAIRAKGTPIKRYGGTSSGPISLMAMVNEVARHVMSGGKRRSALWAGLHWQHSDIEDFINSKNWDTAIRAMKERDFNYPAILDMTNISVCLDNEFFKQIKKSEEVQDFYYKICKSMSKTGEPGFSVDINTDTILRNPCCEVVSADDGDCCNLGSINLSRIRDLDELEYITRLAIRFLFLGTFRGWLPHKKFQEIREKNRRIGLGIMGLHEWCIMNDQSYEPSGKLGEWLSTWKRVSNDEAKKVAKLKEVPIPKGIRAIAPTGTIGIISETTTGIEPIYCVSYKRRFLDEDQKWKYAYVIDPTARRLIEEKGLSPDDIEDSRTLSTKVEKRISMQAFIQDFIDQAISSTINLPEYGEYGNANVKKFAETLLRYLPRLRGITIYPEGARPGAPLTPIKYDTAKKHGDVIYEESLEHCQGGVCGI